MTRNTNPWIVESGQAAQLGLSEQPFALAGGGPIPKAAGQMLARYLLLTEKKQAALSGLDNLSAELWEKEGRSLRLLIEPIQDAWFTMLPGNKGEPLVGNFLAHVTVDDAEKYLESLSEVVETWNAVYDQSTGDIKPKFEVKSNKVEGRTRVEMIADVATTARDPNVPQTNWMLEAAFGPEGKMVAQFWQVDDEQLVFGFATETQMSQLLERVDSGKPEQAVFDPAIATTKLLDQQATWQLLVQPNHCLAWASRVLDELIYAGLSADHDPVFPAMTESPPLGITAKLDGESFECEIVCPAKTWVTLGEYLNKVN